MFFLYGACRHWVFFMFAVEKQNKRITIDLTGRDAVRREKPEKTQFGRSDDSSEKTEDSRKGLGDILRGGLPYSDILYERLVLSLHIYN
ncbi:hypothetical protein HQ34_05540 [Porphyromonas cangingivalis]|nr:hypothetical protein HQ34_05540 [Porphyromonas cangingivalis]